MIEKVELETLTSLIYKYAKCKKNIIWQGKLLLWVNLIYYPNQEPLDDAIAMKEINELINWFTLLRKVTQDKNKI